jgi:hypothetical protein
MNTEEWAKAFIKEHNIPVGTDIDIEEYIKMSKGKIKKNKKYWKNRCKFFENQVTKKDEEMYNLRLDIRNLESIAYKFNDKINDRRESQNKKNLYDQFLPDDSFEQINKRDDSDKRIIENYSVNLYPDHNLTTSYKNQNKGK